MTVIRVHELAKKMGVESKDLIAVLEKMGIKDKTPTSGLDDKETKSLIDKLKAVRKEKEKAKKEKTAPTAEADAAASVEERRKKAAALIGKFSSTLEKPGSAGDRTGRGEGRRTCGRCGSAGADGSSRSAPDRTVTGRTFSLNPSRISGSQRCRTVRACP
jgi:translation initiation factor IF-2